MVERRPAVPDPDLGVMRSVIIVGSVYGIIFGFLISPRPLLPSPTTTTTTLSTPPSLFALFIFILYIILCSLLGGGAVRVIEFFELVLCDFDLGPFIPTKKQPKTSYSLSRGERVGWCVRKKVPLSIEEFVHRYLGMSPSAKFSDIRHG